MLSHEAILHVGNAPTDRAQLKQNLTNAKNTYGADSQPCKTIQAIIDQYIAAHGPKPPAPILPDFKNLTIRPKPPANT